MKQDGERLDRGSFTVIRSTRKTIGLVMKPGQVPELRVPLRMTNAQIDAFISQRQDWLLKHLRQAQARQDAAGSPDVMTMEELRNLAAQAVQVIPGRVAHYAPLVGVNYGHITIRSQHTRWGSCSAAGNLSFNCLLMLAPPQVLDSVVVHELCHRVHMDHSPAFYALVRRVYPEYDRWNRWLKDHDGSLLGRLPE